MVNVKIHSPANSNGTNDPAGWDAASYHDDPIDHIEPIAPFSSEYRQCALRLLEVLRGVDEWMSHTHTGRPPRRWYAVSLALGLASTRGQSETAIALELGLSRACISKEVVTIRKLTNLEDTPAWGLKSPAQRETYKQTNGRRRRLEDRLGDVAPSLIEASDSTDEYHGTDVVASAQ